MCLLVAARIGACHTRRGRGEQTMTRHGPACLEGPITRKRRCWRESSAIRADLVARVRREIAAGTYETPEKWEAALERLLRRLAE
jgi:hypothetical protein